MPQLITIEDQIREKLGQAQKLVLEAQLLAENNEILLYYEIHDFKNLNLDIAQRNKADHWDNSSFCGFYIDEEYY